MSVYLGESARDTRSPFDVLLRRLGALWNELFANPAIDDDLDVRIVFVVLDHPLVEIVYELRWNHAVDHLPRILRGDSDNAIGT